MIRSINLFLQFCTLLPDSLFVNINLFYCSMNQVLCGSSSKILAKYSCAWIIVVAVREIHWNGCTCQKMLFLWMCGLVVSDTDCRWLWLFHLADTCKANYITLAHFEHLKADNSNQYFFVPCLNIHHVFWTAFFAALTYWNPQLSVYELWSVFLITSSKYLGPVNHVDTALACVGMLYSWGMLCFLSLQTVISFLSPPEYVSVVLSFHSDIRESSVVLGLDVQF